MISSETGPAPRPIPGNPRDGITETAAAEFLPWLQEWRQRHALSAFEFLYVLQVVMGRTIQSLVLAEREAIKIPGAQNG